MQYGNKVTAPVYLGKGDEKSPKLKTGRVTYIHPKKRFFVVEFVGTGGRYRESYLFPPAKKNKLSRPSVPSGRHECRPVSEHDMRIAWEMRRRGKNRREVADALHCGENRVNTILERAYKKYGKPVKS